MFISRLLAKTSSQTFTEQELKNHLENYDEEEFGVGAFNSVDALKYYLESKGVVFGEGLSGEIFEWSKDIGKLSSYVLGCIHDEDGVLYDTETPLPEFEFGEGVFCYPRVELYGILESEGFGNDKPEIDYLDMPDEDMLERHKRKKDNKW